MIDDRYEYFDEYYPEEDYDREYVNNRDDDDSFEDDCDELLEKINKVRKIYDMSSADRAILDIIEELIELL